MADLGSFEWALNELRVNGDKYRSVERLQWLASTLSADVPGANERSVYLLFNSAPKEIYQPSRWCI